MKIRDGEAQTQTQEISTNLITAQKIQFPLPGAVTHWNKAGVDEVWACSAWFWQQFHSIIIVCVQRNTVSVSVSVWNTENVLDAVHSVALRG